MFEKGLTAGDWWVRLEKRNRTEDDMDYKYKVGDRVRFQTATEGKLQGEIESFSDTGTVYIKVNDFSTWIVNPSKDVIVDEGIKEYYIIELLLPEPYTQPPTYDKVEDSGERHEFSTGSVRDIREGKGRWDLLPHYPLLRLAQHYENGAKKYGDHNWKKGQPLSVFISSGMSHFSKVSDCQKNEDHAAAAAWNVFGFIWTAEQIRLGKLPKELDDIGWCDE